MADFKSADSQRLQAEVRRAEAVFKQAQREYNLALSVAVDTSFSADGSSGLRISARRYSAALREYSEAVGHWTDHVLGH